MADVPVLEAAEEQPAAAGKRKKWLIIGAVTLLVLGGGGAGAFFLLGQDTQANKAQEKVKEPHAPALYVALDPPFVVNFEGDQVVRFLQVAVQVMTRDPSTVEMLKANDPVVRNDLLLLLANQNYEVIATRAGKEKLRSDALVAIRHVIDSSGGKSANVEQVYFTSFVMQ